MKRALLALVSAFTLVAINFAAWGADSIVPDPTRQISASDCTNPDNFFKDQFPNLTNGPQGGGPVTQTYAVDGVDGPVTLSLTWNNKNVVSFEVIGGVAYVEKMFVKSGYTLFYDFGEGVTSYSGLNDVNKAQDVSHLEFCLAPPPPDVTNPTLTISSPKSGETIFGDTITVVFEAFDDESGLADGYPQASLSGQADVDMVCTEDPVDSGQFSCTASGLAPGEYTITVVAQDGSQNTTTITITNITLDNSQALSSCTGVLGDKDFSGGGDTQNGDGCQITATLNVQTPPDIAPECSDSNPPLYCFISGYQYEPDPSKFTGLGCDSCGENYCGTYGLPDIRTKCPDFADFDTASGACTDPVTGEDVEWVPDPTKIGVLHISDVAKDGPEGPVPGTLGENVYGYKGCFVASQLSRLGPLEDQFANDQGIPEWPSDPPTGLVWTVTYTLNGALNPDVIIPCNLGDTFASQGGYFPLNKTASIDFSSLSPDQAIVLAATQDCQNPPRTLTRDNGVDVGNIFEWGPGGPVAFKNAQAQKQFDAILGPTLDCARGDYIKGKVKFSEITSPIKQAQSQFKNGTVAALVRAYEDLQDSACAIRAAKWNVTAENCPGDLLSRVENTAYRMKDLIVALDPAFNVDGLRESPCLIEP